MKNTIDCKRCGEPIEIEKDNVKRSYAKHIPFCRINEKDKKEFKGLIYHLNGTLHAMTTWSVDHDDTFNKELSEMALLANDLTEMIDNS